MNRANEEDEAKMEATASQVKMPHIAYALYFIPS